MYRTYLIAFHTFTEVYEGFYACLIASLQSPK